MTSKRLFINAMREDLRHKTWLAALSFLANMLVQPVMCLMIWDDLAEYRASMEFLGYTSEQQVQEILLQYGGDTMALSGFVAIAVAFMAGLAAFRFLFHKNSADLYHGLPIRRSMLFWVCYLDGLLVWLVPFLVCLGLSGAVMRSSLREIPGPAGAGWGLTLTAFSCILVCVVVFLLVYNLVLVAVMLSGNALNALVSAMVLGFGGICVWSVAYLFFEMYMDTFASMFWGGGEAWGAVYASPLVSAMVALITAVEEMKIMPWQGEMQRILLINLGIAAFLGLCAWILYNRRPSEHAEQGIRNRAVAALFRAVCGVGAGMCGWVLFSLLSENRPVLWGCFGAALGAALVFGGLDIIFQMDFKAFLSHKLQMGAAVALTLLLCFGFCQDWLGYDAYLPDKEDIAEISIYHPFFTNRRIGEKDMLVRTGLRDMELAYPYLESVTAWQTWEGRNGAAGGTALDDEGAFDGAVQKTATQQVDTRVTLKNGRSYYRSYEVPEQDREVLLALLTSEAYMRQAYLVDESAAENASGRMTLSRGDSQLAVGNADPETVRSIIRAYNQDLAEDPERAVADQGRLLVRVQLNTWDSIGLEVYDDMEHTMEALRQAGCGDWVRVEEASDIASVELGLFYDGKDYLTGQAVTGEDRIAAARLTYGVYGEETEEELKSRYQEAAEAFQETWPAGSEETAYREGAVERDSLFITEPNEVGELLEWMDYELPSRNIALFCQERVRVTVTARDGRVFAGYLRKGRLPEKFIYRFGEL